MGMGKGSKSEKRPGKAGKALARATEPRRSLAWRILKWVVLGGLVVAAAGTLAIAIMFWVYGSDPQMPTAEELANYHGKQVSRVYDVKGRLIGEIYDERRTSVPISEVAPVMIQAMTSAEDKNFFEHSGVDFGGIARAMWVNFSHGETKQGASTITQQVVKTMLLTPEGKLAPRTMRRKVQEIILARRLEKVLTKDQILALYLNQISFGHRRFGIEEASLYYFAKHAKALDVGEAALLAGIPQAPERLSPRRHPEAAKARQVEVLRRMARNGYISEAEAQRWIDAPIKLVDDDDDAPAAAPEILDLVRKELVKRYGADKLDKLGLSVRTSIDLELERAARQALRTGLYALDKRHGYAGPLARVTGDKQVKKLAALAKALGGAPRIDQTYEGVVLKVDDALREMVVDLGDWRVAVLLGKDDRYLPAGKRPAEVYAPGDLVRVRLTPGRAVKSADVKDAAVLAQGPDGAVVIIDPTTHQVLALVGGSEMQPGDFDRATRARRQPGSSFKPFVYAAAIASKQFTSASLVNDAPEVYDLWKPKNYEQGRFLGPVRLRTALALSINTVSIRLIAAVGPAVVAALAHAMGISGELPAELSLALGSGEVTPIDLVNGYTTLAAGGMVAEPQIILSIGEERLPAPVSKLALPADVAYVVTSLMTSVVEEGTAVAARKLKRQIAGKTGTSNVKRDTRDAWFVGFTPDLVCGVWIGFDDNRNLGRGETGARAALPVWIDVMKVALSSHGAKTFKRPPGVVTARIDLASGKLAPPGAPPATTREEVFLDGTVPVEVAPAPGEVNPDTFIQDQMDAAANADPDRKPSESEAPGEQPGRAGGTDGDDDLAGGGKHGPPPGAHDDDENAGATDVVP
jgi:penicillin-binding protein 1A